jgi:putative copper export protein
VLRTFGAAAATCVGVLAVTGLYLSSTVVGSVDAALLAVYGRVLVLQVTFVGVAALLGPTHHPRLRRPDATARAQRRGRERCPRRRGGRDRGGRPHPRWSRSAEATRKP